MNLTPQHIPSAPSRRARFGIARPLLWPWGLSAAMVITALSATTPKAGDTLPKREYVSFKLIAERNIFDSSRARGSTRGGETRKPNRVDTLSLVGAMIYDKGPYAFFDGSSSEFRQVLDAGKTIAGFKIVEVNGDEVKLESGTNVVQLRVGMQMRREEGGEWEVAGGGMPTQASAGSSSSETAASSSSDSAGEESDIIKRLMQQREQELK